MIATVTSLPAAVLYLLLLVAELFGAGGDLTADYLQDGSPAYRVSLTTLAPDASRTLRIVAESEGEAPLVYTVEASELAGHNQLVYSAGTAIPVIMNLAPALERAAMARIPADWTLELPSDAHLASADLDVGLGSTIHFLRREGTTIVSAPEPGIVLLVVED